MAPNLAGAFAEHARRAPERLALAVDDAKYTYGDLAGRCSSIAGFLRDGRPASTADEPEWRVAILTSRSATAFASILGTVWAGGSYVPINAGLPEDRLISLLQRARCSVLLADDAGARRLTESIRAHAPSRIVAPTSALPTAADGIVDWTDVLAYPPLVEPVSIARERTAYVLFTSGTTGVPKGVMVSTGSVSDFVETVRKRFALSDGDRFSQHAELTFDLSVFDQFACWTAGGSLHVVPDGQRMAPIRFINEHAVTVWFSVPSVITFVTRMKMLTPGLLPTLRVSLFAGEALAVVAALAWKEATPNGIVENHYGPTEATVAITGQTVGDLPRATEERGSVAIGAAYTGQHAAIIDESGRFLPAGERGELALAGSQLMTGYFEDEELTARRCPMLDHPEIGRSRWYRTGDLACMDADGTFHHLGRIDNQIKLLGHRIELEDIETHLRDASGTNSVCVVAWPVENGVVQGITAFVAGTTRARAEILERLKTRVPEYMVPRGLHFVDDLPLSTNGKVDRKALITELATKHSPRPL